ncbi:uncharacterized protein LODBEIA_P43380 [Lodderomyces beijingensis]|uniref:Nucleoporin NDC1 n=1 Tax=Lodderomyces beijingensis TaxID=1775926 RepID=A0ABP0ZQB2_9ASCO
MSTPLQCRGTDSEYHRVFNKVLKKRLKFLLKINIILSVVGAIALDLPFQSNLSRWNRILVMVFIKCPLLFTSLTLIRESRKKDSTVEFTPCKTLGSQICHAVISRQFLQVSLFHVASALLVYGFFIFQLPFTFEYYLISKEYRKSPLLNDQWVYYWTNAVTLAAYYAANQLVFQRNMIKVSYGRYRINPQSALFSHIAEAFGHSLGLNLIFTVGFPILYWFIKPYIYMSLVWLSLFGIDTSTPPNNVTISTYMKMTLLSNVILLGWELANHSFAVYATIGCLDGKKPLSTYSDDPFRCLLGGLKDVSSARQLSRLTAFQELMYIATSSDKEAVKLRLALFSIKSKKDNIWPQLYTECELVIKEVGDRVNHRSANDMKVLNGLKLSVDNDLGPKNKSSRVPDLFGREEQVRKARKEDETRNQSSKSTHFFARIHDSETLRYLDKVYQKSTINKHLNLNRVNAVLCQYRDKLLDSDLGLFFRTTLKRDCESRVRNPVNFGNSIIAISGILQHSLEDDSVGIVQDDDVAAVLNLFERTFRVCDNYVTHTPASVFRASSQGKDSLIFRLSELTLGKFNSLCLQFNGQLYDLNLNQRTYKMAKWVVNIAIADREQLERRY